MLKNIPPILSPEMLKVLCEMGHSDRIVIADANFPAESMGKNAIVLRADGHGAVELLDAILTLFPLDTYVEHPTGERHRINNAHFMMVALDEHDKPMRVPGLKLLTDDEELAWRHGEERRRIRMQRLKDKLDGI